MFILAQTGPEPRALARTVWELVYGEAMAFRSVVFKLALLSALLVFGAGALLSRSLFSPLAASLAAFAATAFLAGRILRAQSVEKREETLARNFLSVVSHKLRTPLMIVIGYLDLLQEDPAGRLDEFQAKAVATMVKEVERLHILVEKLLMYSTALSAETLDMDPRETSLVLVVESAIKGLSDVIGTPGVRILWDREAVTALPCVRADVLLLSEALRNLLENAIRFNHGKVKEVRIGAVLEGSRVRLSVADNGPGIPLDEQARVFQRFYQIDEHFTGQALGMGLGLPFVQNVVTAHGGRVGLRSEPGKGCEFFFTVPTA